MSDSPELKTPDNSEAPDEKSEKETVEAGLALSLDSEVPAEQARAKLALETAGNQESEEEAEKDEWLELYGIDEDYARMVRETLGEAEGPEGKKRQFQEDFEDDE